MPANKMPWISLINLRVRSLPRQLIFENRPSDDAARRRAHPTRTGQLLAFKQPMADQQALFQQALAAAVQR